MRGPQLEDGYTRIANEILEIISKAKFNGTQFKILMVIWRYTYGFNRKDSEFSLNFLSEATNSNKQQVKRELDKLIEDKVITIVKEADFNTSRILSFNKNYSEWKIEGLQYIKKDTVSELADSRVSELEYSTVSELAYTTVSGLAYQERQYKDNIKKNTITTIEEQLEEDPYNFTEEKQQEEKTVARVDADSTKQFSPVGIIENYYLRKVRNQVMSSSNDRRYIIQAYETYKDIDFIIGVIESATKDNIRRNGECKINSFRYFNKILKEEWEKKSMTKEVTEDGATSRNNQPNFRFDKSKFLWQEGE